MIYNQLGSAVYEYNKLFFHHKVTGVGINTEWGLLMASISEDTGEETPLQVFFNASINSAFLDNY